MVTISEPARQASGVLSHAVISPYQLGETKIHVLVPERVGAGERLPTLYVLPVEKLDGRAWGDPMAEILAHGFYNQHRLLCVMPTFSHAPWYGDHPHDPRKRQESHLLNVVLPFVERTYPAGAARLLVGFSKSGWGAYSLLLRHPEVFTRAAAWDAPLGQASPSKYGMSEMFPTQQSLALYDVWDFLKQRAALLAGSTRLALLGYGDFRGHHQATHHHMLKLGIPHHYQDGPRREHHWQSDWMADAVRLLAAESDE